MKGKIALEEHVSTEENNKRWDLRFEAARHGKHYMANVERRLFDTETRLEEMDEFGIETAILSLTTPGAQSILDSNQAVDFAKRTNDLITEQFVEPHQGRFYAFATLALQDPRAAADELEHRGVSHERRLRTGGPAQFAEVHHQQWPAIFPGGRECRLGQRPL